MDLQTLFCEQGGSQPSEEWTRVFARFLGVFSEWLVVPWLQEQGEILVGPGMSGRSYSPQRPKVSLGNENFEYDWLLRKDGKLVLIESKCWIAYTGFNKMFEENDYVRKFQDKNRPGVSENKGLYRFVCHNKTRDFVMKSPAEYSKKPIDHRWLLWWDTEGGASGKRCEGNEEVTIFSIREIVAESWNGCGGGEDNEFQELMSMTFLSPMKAALEVIEKGISCSR